MACGRLPSLNREPGPGTGIRELGAGTGRRDDRPRGHSGAGERGERTALGAAVRGGQRVLSPVPAGPRGRGGQCWHPCPARRGSEGARGGEGSGSHLCLGANRCEYLPGVGAGGRTWAAPVSEQPGQCGARVCGALVGRAGGRLLRRARGWAGGSAAGETGRAPASLSAALPGPAQVPLLLLPGSLLLALVLRIRQTPGLVTCGFQKTGYAGCSDCKGLRLSVFIRVCVPWGVVRVGVEAEGCAPSPRPWPSER